MGRFISYTIITLASAYILYISFIADRLGIYVADRNVLIVNYYTFIKVFALIAFAFGVIGLCLYLSDKYREINIRDELSKIRDYMSDRKLLIVVAFILLSILSPVFILFAAIMILAPIKEAKIDAFLKRNSLELLFIFTVIFSGFVIPSQPIKSQTANQRLSNFNNADLSATSIQINSFGTDTSNFTIGDWINSLSYNPDLEYYKDKKVDVIGFVYDPEFLNLPDDMFVVARFIIRCCAADGTPIGLKVNFAWDEDFNVDQWVRVKGKFVIKEINGTKELIIEPTSVENTEQPNNPYIT